MMRSVPRFPFGALRSTASVAACVFVLSAAKADPDCGKSGGWVTSMTYAALKNAGTITPDQLAPKPIGSVQIASQKIGPDLYRQVFDVTIPLKDGKTVEAIAVNDASREECSMSAVKVYPVIGPIK